MSLESLKSLLPDYAKDLKLNLSSLAAETALTQQQLAGTFIASALASRQPQVIATINDEFAAKLEPAALNAAKAAAAIMGMNNIYYRFVHLAGGDYKKMPARLRMNVMANPGVEKADFELWSLPKKRDEAQLLYAMANETANIHLGSPEMVKRVCRDLNQRPSRWLHEASKKMVAKIAKDWLEWRGLAGRVTP